MSHSIALVDNEPDTVKLFDDILTANGYNVAGFTNSLLALEHIKENHKEIDLILCDYKMPYLSGYDLALKIAEINSAIRIIIITAVNDIGNNPLKLQVYLNHY